MYPIQSIIDEEGGQHVEFVFKVVASNSKSFLINVIYSSMRAFYNHFMISSLKECHKDLADLPPFPRRTFFSTSTDEQFLVKSLVELGRFFKAFMAKNRLARSSMMMTYFASKQVDQESEKKIVQLSDTVFQAKKDARRKKSKRQVPPSCGQRQKKALYFSSDFKSLISPQRIHPEPEQKESTHKTYDFSLNLENTQIINLGLPDEKNISTYLNLIPSARLSSTRYL